MRRVFSLLLSSRLIFYEKLNYCRYTFTSMALASKESQLLDEPLRTISAYDLDSDGDAFLKLNGGKCLKDYEQVASYNWLGTPSRPIIVVPGAPKILVNWKGGKLQKDSGEQIPDENHHMLPKYPMEPLFQAAKILNEGEGACDGCSEFKFQNFDIATDRNNLRKLFSFVADDSSKRDKYFRIDIQVIGRLVCLIRCHHDDTAAFTRRTISYGADFERKMTKISNDFCTGSFRQIASYQFGTLKMLVRFEVDCADYDKTPADRAKTSVAENSNEKSTTVVDCLSGTLAKLNLSKNVDKNAPGSVLQVQKLGVKKQYHLVELATKRTRTPFPKHVWPQMFFSGTQTLVIGWQNWGNVQYVERFTAQEVIDEYGGFPSDNLSRMHSLLQKIVEFVREKTADRKDDEKSRHFSIIWNHDFKRSLKIFENENPERFAVSDDLKSYVAEN